MKYLRSIAFALLMLTNLNVFAQTPPAKWFVSANGNLYLPVNNRNKGIYPILGFDKNTTPKILLGGVGVGASYIHPISKSLAWKAQTNFSKHTYWDEPIVMRDYVANAVGEFQSGASDYNLGFAGMLHYYPVENFSIGAGISAQLTVLSLSRTPEMRIGTDIDMGVAANRYYKLLVPMIPLELSYELRKLLFNIRYEAGLINRLKGDLADYKTDKFSLLTFEIGFKIH